MRQVSAPSKSSRSRNVLLASLSQSDWRLLDKRLTPVPLELGKVLEAPREPIDHIYFPESGIVSVVALGGRNQRIEVGLFGRDGMSGACVVMGNHRSPHETFAQVAGTALRLPAEDLRKSMQKSASMHALFLRFVQTLAIQTAHTALSNGSDKLEERLARWVLMSHDRVDGNELRLTHEFLALMLGVHRPGVTLALQSLESRGLIRSKRGIIHVVDRKGLEAGANGSYGVPEAEYRRLLG